MVGKGFPGSAGRKRGRMGKDETRRTRFWVSRWRLRRLPEMFQEIVAGTPFEGSRLVFTGNVRKRYRSAETREFFPANYEFEALPTVDAYEPIPGFRFAGYVQTDDGGANYTLSRLDPDFEFTKEIADSLDPLRCDQCGTRRRRVRQFVLVEKDTGKLVVVGGSCAKEFRGVNLDEEIRKAFSFVGLVSAGMEERGMCGWGGGHCTPDLSLAIAIAEAVIDRYGYVSQAEARRKEDQRVVSTGGRLGDFFRPRSHGRPDPEWDAIHDFVEERADAIYTRATQLADTQFAELLEYANAQLERNWSEFNHNVVAWLSGEDKIKSHGISAYLGSLKGRIEDNLKKTTKREAEEKAKPPCKGFDGAPVNKMADWGEFKVINVKFKEGYYGDSYGFLCVRETDTATEKVWFKIGLSSEACRAWEKEVGDDVLLPRDRDVFVTIRGKLSEVKGDISFGKMVKFKAVRSDKLAA